MANNISGIVYIAYGKQYIEEAKRSIESVRQFSTLPALIINDIPLLNKPFLINKPYVLSQADIPFERFLFLDTDTLVLDNIEPMFQILDDFDIAAAHAWIRNGPITRLNTGVILMKNNQEFLKDWSERTLQYWKATQNNDDQPSFTEAVYKSNLRFYTLAPEFNLRIANIVYASGKVFVVHGRHERVKAAAKLINYNTLPRIWNGKQRTVDEV